jgi:uncharacterized protein YutE (UPF0331/DUF86 family)
MKFKVNDKLDDLSRYYDELLEDLPSDNDFLNNRLTRRGIEKTLELIVETILDIANIIISEKNLEKPIDSKSSIMVLAKEKIIAISLAEKIKDLVSFRNLLVHRYGKLDEEKELIHIKENHGDIADFLEAISN